MLVVVSGCWWMLVDVGGHDRIRFEDGTLNFELRL